MGVINTKILLTQTLSPIFMLHILFVFLTLNPARPSIELYTHKNKSLSNGTSVDPEYDHSAKRFRCSIMWAHNNDVRSCQLQSCHIWLGVKTTASGARRGDFALFWKTKCLPKWQLTIFSTDPHTFWRFYCITYFII